MGTLFCHPIIRKITRMISTLITITILLVSVIFFSVKVLAYKNAAPSAKDWNASNSCYFITYRPNYKPYDGVGRVLKLFSNQSFFIVYNKENELLRNSAWYFLENINSPIF